MKNNDDGSILDRDKIKKRVEQIKKFLCVVSDSDNYNIAINEYKKEALQVLTNSTESMSVDEQNDFFSKTDKYMVFLEALILLLKNPDLESPIIEDEIPKHYKNNIYRGLVRGKFYISETVYSEEKEYSFEVEKSKDKLDDKFKGVFSNIIYKTKSEVDFDINNKVVLKMIAENHLVPMVIYLYVITQDNIFSSDEIKEYNMLNNLFMHALDVHMKDSNYNSSFLGRIDLSESNVIDTKLLVTVKELSYLWALMKPKNKYDYSMLDTAKVLFDNSSNDLFRKLYYEFEKVHRRINQGFNKPVLNMIKNHQDNKKIQLELSCKADEYLVNPTMNVNNKPMIKLNQACYGIDSVIYSMLRMIKENQSDVSEKVRALFNETFSLKNNIDDNRLVKDETLVNEYIEDKWTQLKSLKRANKNNNNEIKSDFKDNLRNNIVRRLDFISDWYESIKLVKEYKYRDAKLISDCRESILSIFDKILLETDNYDCFTGNIISYSVSRMIKYLKEFGENYDNGMFDEFLKTPYIIISDNTPVINDALFDIEGYEPWRLILMHIASEKVSFKQAVENIDNHNKLDWYNNFGQYISILKKMPKSKEIKLENAIANAKKISEKQVDDIKGDLEMAYAYSRIDETVAERYRDVIDSIKQDFYTYNEFGKFYMFLEAIRKMIDSESIRKEIDIENRLKELEKNSEIRKKHQRQIESAKKCILNKNYSVAEEYIFEISDDELSGSINDVFLNSETQYFSDFLTKEKALYSECYLNKSGRLNIWANRYLKGIYDNDFSQKNIESSEVIIRNWPFKKTSINRMIDYKVEHIKIKNLIENIGFNVKTVKLIPEQSLKLDVYKLQVKVVKRNKMDYTHPIAIYGTNMDEELYVVNVFGDHSPQELLTDISDLSVGNNVIILLNTCFTINKRRELADKIKNHEKSINKPFLLIDQVLILYLCTLEKSDRLPALLQCSLPFVKYQPYVNGSGLIPDEMFIGRKQELSQILDLNGPCLLYGGRQLGKSALLSRARSIKHNPSDKKYAFHIDANKLKSKELLDKVISELVGSKIISRTLKGKNVEWKDIFNELEDRFKKSIVKELTLYIDEADSFLDDISRRNYTELSVFVELRRKSNNRFRFIFAGLHNVIRFEKGVKSNSTLPQLGNPLCIKPLSPADSFKLIEKPLTYLGFKLEEDQMALILANSLYFPGILHSFGYSIVNSVIKLYMKKVYSLDNNPPYSLDELTLKSILNQEQIINEIKRKINITLTLDPRYMKLASLFAYLYHTERENIRGFNGFTIDEIFKFIKENEIELLMPMKKEDVLSLLLEMKDMKVLIKKANEDRFRLRKSIFRDYIAADEDKALMALLGE